MKIRDGRGFPTQNFDKVVAVRVGSKRDFNRSNRTGVLLVYWMACTCKGDGSGHETHPAD